jgi:uncharacterized protein YkwD
MQRAQITITLPGTVLLLAGSFLTGCKGSPAGSNPAVDYAVEKKLCLDETNRYRATLGLPAVAWSTELEAFAESGVRYDAARNRAHAHFAAAKPNPSDAENEIPGWPLSNYKTVSKVVEEGLKMMWDEGPGGGHYENIKGSHTALGCGILVTEAGRVWVIQDFK